MSDRTLLPAELLTFLTKERDSILKKSLHISTQVAQIISEDNDSPYFVDLADRLRIEGESISWLTLLIGDFARLRTVQTFMNYGHLHQVPNNIQDRSRMQVIFGILFSLD